LGEGREVQLEKCNPDQEISVVFAPVQFYPKFKQ
jgi:hypothetical protein